MEATRQRATERERRLECQPIELSIEGLERRRIQLLAQRRQLDRIELLAGRTIEVPHRTR